MIEQITRYKVYGPELRELKANPGAGPEETELTSRSVYLEIGASEKPLVYQFFF